MAAGLAAPEWNGEVTGDLDGDGWPECLVAAYIDLKNKVPKPLGPSQDYYGLPDHLYINNGDGTSGCDRTGWAAIGSSEGWAGC